MGLVGALVLKQPNRTFHGLMVLHAASIVDAKLPLRLWLLTQLALQKGWLALPEHTVVVAFVTDLRRLLNESRGLFLLLVRLA